MWPWSSAGRKREARAAWLAWAFVVASAGSRADESKGETMPVTSAVERVAVSWQSPGKVWREAEAFAAARTDCEVLFGRGDSMLPLFPDRTVIVVRRTPLAELRAGMTVVYFGDRGRPVAHVLMARAAGGWIAKGLANGEADRTRVTRHNYVGQVVRAYVPGFDKDEGVGSPMKPTAADSAAGGGQ